MNKINWVSDCYHDFLQICVLLFFVTFHIVMCIVNFAVYDLLFMYIINLTNRLILI